MYHTYYRDYRRYAWRFTALSSGPRAISECSHTDGEPYSMALCRTSSLPRLRG
ncbi:hypothetical protein [Pseudomonas typographi]|uniref:DUF1508 domain-containing protein n=1 Tax=Pseudomonas typographi TaxID=2715964 RepID=A0ABR7Z6D1_9PSED|nr:hypothetical protein [Pseudomonas typographi]MBD1554294.1 hypothetical protein [Pseudomonas typographi]MBD1589523.1 hypothetical protein [Pseudomonas typographi]MBD1600903.1 hypothetical protein [Pseudomonas typographi]